MKNGQKKIFKKMGRGKEKLSLRQYGKKNQKNKKKKTRKVKPKYNELYVRVCFLV